MRRAFAVLVAALLGTLGLLVAPASAGAAPEARQVPPRVLSYGLTYPSEQPAQRIDYVTVSAGIAITGARVPATLASDHRPVLASLTVTRGE